jgi:hypothetical protein
VETISQIEPARAYAQHLVTTRLLECLHDPAGQSSRLQMIYPYAPPNCNTPAKDSTLPWSPCYQSAEVRGRSLILIRLRTCRGKSPLSGMDSDLEAFSHNPADGSVAALPGQTAAKTNYLNPRFLSY